jgi:hypothetical protein
MVTVVAEKAHSKNQNPMLTGSPVKKKLVVPIKVLPTTESCPPNAKAYPTK